MLKSSDLLTKHFLQIAKRMYSSKCDVAVCQLTATNNKIKNLDTVKKLVAEAASKNAKMVFLPEASDFIGSSKKEIDDLAEPLEGPTMTEYKNLAKQFGLWLSIGGFHEIPSFPSENRLCNSHVLIDDNGDIKSIYRKLHLFDTYIPRKNIKLCESDNVMPGLEIVPPVQTPAGQLSLSICYDLRFPELSTILRKQGATILTYPSAFTNVTGEAHWEVLLRARAIENQCYVIAAAQYGKHNEKRISHGRAMIVDPWGKIVAECMKYNEDIPTNASIALATINCDLVNRVREDMQVFQHRRNDIYELRCSNNSTNNVINDNATFSFADKIIPGATVFYKTKYCYAFTNIRCVVPGHVLISSLRPANFLEDLTPEEVSDIFQTSVKVQQVMKQVYNATATSLCVQDGKHAGQTVPQVHVHILPRKSGDFSRNDDIYEELAKHDRENNPDPVRSLEEMAAEAKLLRKYFNS